MKNVRLIILSLFITSVLPFFSTAVVAQTLMLQAEQTIGNANDTVSVDITVHNFNCLVTTQFSMNWDSTQLQFLGLSNYGLPSLDTTNFGINTNNLAFSWDDDTFTGVTLGDSTAIFTIDFLVTGIVGDSAKINFISNPTVIEAAVCGTYSTITIQPSDGFVAIVPALTFMTTVIDVLCSGDSTAIIDLTPSGGIAPFTYLWNTGSTTEDLINISAGIYSCTITDVVGQVTEAGMINVLEPPSLQTASNITHPLCDGNNDGMIDLVLNGGTAPYGYSWSNGASTEDLQMLSAGSYVCTITDGNGCSLTTNPIILIAPDNLEAAQVLVTDAPNGNGGGFIDITIQGGTEPYSYQWSNGNTTEDISNLTRGFYHCDITDINDCTLRVDSIFVSIVNTQHVTQNDDIHLFPNPASNLVTIQISSSVQGTSTVIIYNSVGLKIEELVMRTGNYQIDVANYPNGIYFLQVQNEKIDTIKKLVVSR